MIESTVKKQLRLLKEQQKNRLVKKRLIENRISIIIENANRVGTRRSLSKKAKHELGFKLYAELHRLHKHNLISENETLTDLVDILKNQIGNLGFATLEGVLIEPLVNSILSKLGMGGFFKNALVSALSTDPEVLVDAFKDCNALVKLISEVIVEATFMMIQENQGLSGRGYDVLRNALGNAVKETSFSNTVQTGIKDLICDIFDELKTGIQGLGGI